VAENFAAARLAAEQAVLCQQALNGTAGKVCQAAWVAPVLR
jgi:hypothetical protein